MISIRTHFVVVALCVCLHAPHCRAEGVVDWKSLASNHPTWVFLGDSNTYAGGYVALIDAHINRDRELVEIINLGVGSETASGLSEPDHPFYRPCIHQRLEKCLAMTKPDLVFCSYGMNDGIYAPLNEQRMQAYQRGMTELSQLVRAAGARLVVLTPPPFEASALPENKFGPSKKSGQFAWFAPSKEYDQVIQAQRQWCNDNSVQADLVVDVYGALAESKELNSKNFTRDGIHFDSNGHEIIATTILQELAAPEDISKAVSKQDSNVARQRMLLIRDAWLTATGKNRPGLAAGLPLAIARQRASQLLVD